MKRFNSDQEKAEFEKLDQLVSEEMKLVPDTDRNRYSIREDIAGAIFKAQMDNSHPLAFGYSSNYFTLKTQSSPRYAFLNQGNVAVIASSSDHLSGFVGEIAKSKISNSLVFGVKQKGRGNIVYMVDNPLFRSFWHGGKLCFANALFFVNN